MANCSDFSGPRDHRNLVIEAMLIEAESKQDFKHHWGEKKEMVDSF